MTMPKNNRRYNDAQSSSIEDDLKTLHKRVNDYHEKLGGLENRVYSLESRSEIQDKKLDNLYKIIVGGGGVDERSMRDDVRDTKSALSSINLSLSELKTFIEGVDLEVVVKNIRDIQEWQSNHDKHAHDEQAKKEGRRYEFVIAIVLIVVNILMAGLPQFIIGWNQLFSN